MTSDPTKHSKVTGKNEAKLYPQIQISYQIQINILLKQQKVSCP